MHKDTQKTFSLHCTLLICLATARTLITLRDSTFGLLGNTLSNYLKYKRPENTLYIMEIFKCLKIDCE